RNLRFGARQSPAHQGRAGSAAAAAPARLCAPAASRNPLLRALPVGPVPPSAHRLHPPRRGLPRARGGLRRRGKRRRLTRATAQPARSGGGFFIGGTSVEGSTGTPPTEAPQWRCGPVARPVAPTVPISSPCRTASPSFTFTVSRWA